MMAVVFLVGGLLAAKASRYGGKLLPDFLSGVGGIAPSALLIMMAMSVKHIITEGGIKELTRQSLTNMKAILAEAGLTMSNVVKTTVFLADMADFAEMNEVYASFFEGVCPARSAVAVKTLPKNALVEIECIAVR